MLTLILPFCRVPISISSIDLNMYKFVFICLPGGFNVDSPSGANGHRLASGGAGGHAACLSPGRSHAGRQGRSQGNRSIELHTNET